MGYVKRKLGPKCRNFQSGVLKPVRKKCYRGLWIGGLLLVVCAVTLYLFHIRNAKKDRIAKAYGYERTRTESTWVSQTSKEESWGCSRSVPQETIQFFRAQGFNEKTARTMAEGFERDIEERIRAQSR